MSLGIQILSLFVLHYLGCVGLGTSCYIMVARNIYSSGGKAHEEGKRADNATRVTFTRKEKFY
jgi:hypothetical protein